jgi:hypothetical protein
MSKACPNCSTTLADDSVFCVACGRPVAVVAAPPVAAAPTPAVSNSPAPSHPPVPARSGGGTNFLLLGCGCLVFASIAIVLVAALGFFFMREEFQKAVESVGIAVSGAAASRNEDLVGTWVLESRAANPDPDDIVEFRLEGGRIIGVSREIGSNHRLVLDPAPGGGWAGTVTADDTTDPIAATISADKARLTITVKPGTAGAQSATLIRTAGRPAATEFPGIGPITEENSTVVENDPGLARYEGNWRADEGIAGENNLLTFAISGAELVGRGGPGNRFTMRLRPAEIGGLTGSFSDGEGNTVPITARLSRDWNTIYVTYNPPASEPLTSSFSRVD